MPTPPDPLPLSRRGLTAPPPPPPADGTARADRTREYVVACGDSGLGNYLKALPPYVDLVERDYPGVYEEMLLDEVVASSFKTVVYSVLSEGADVRPLVDDAKDPDYATAKEYALEAEAALDAFDLDPWDLCRELLHCLALGWVAAEKTVGTVEGGKYDGLDGWESVRVKPRRNTTPVVTPANELKGYLCRIVGRPWGQFQGPVVGDPTRLPNYLPREKFIHAAWDTRESDPRGQSILRPVYRRWYEKIQTCGEWLKHLAQFGSPWVVGTTARGSDSAAAVDVFGNPTGADDALSPEQAFLNKLVLFRGGGAIAVPEGYTIALLQSASAGDAFLKKVDASDRAITQGITLQTLATTEGEHQARAAAQVHQDTLGLVPGAVRRWLARLFTRQLLRPLTVMNHGADAARLAPVLGLEKAPKEDRAKLITAYAGAGWQFAPSQLPAVDEELGLEPRTPEEAKPPAPEVPPSGQKAPGDGGSKPPPVGGKGGKPSGREAGFGFDPSEPRDEAGKWTAGGDSAAHMALGDRLEEAGRWYDRAFSEGGTHDGAHAALYEAAYGDDPSALAPADYAHFDPAAVEAEVRAAAGAAHAAAASARTLAAETAQRLEGLVPPKAHAALATYARTLGPKLEAGLAKLDASAAKVVALARAVPPHVPELRPPYDPARYEDIDHWRLEPAEGTAEYGRRQAAAREYDREYDRREAADARRDSAIVRLESAAEKFNRALAAVADRTGLESFADRAGAALAQAEDAHRVEGYRREDAAGSAGPSGREAGFGFDPSEPRDEAGKWTAGGGAKVRAAMRKSDRLMAEAQQLGFEAAAKYDRLATLVPRDQAALRAAIRDARTHALTEGYREGVRQAGVVLKAAVKAGIVSGPAFALANTALGALHKAHGLAKEAHRLRRIAYKVRRRAKGPPDAAGGKGGNPSGQEAGFAFDPDLHPRDRIGRFAEAAGAEVAAHVTANAGARTSELHRSTGAVLKKALAELKPKVRAEVDALLPRAVARLAEVTGLPEDAFRPLLKGAGGALTDAVMDHYRGHARELQSDIRDRMARWQPEDAARALAGKFGPPSLTKEDVADALDDHIGRVVDRYVEEHDPPEGLPPAEEEVAVARVTREAEQLESAVRAVLWATFNPPRTAGFAFDPDEPRDEAGKWTAGGPGAARTGDVAGDLRANFPSDPKAARDVLYARLGDEGQAGRDLRDEPGHPAHEHFHVLAALPGGDHFLLPKAGADAKAGLRAVRRREGDGFFARRALAHDVDHAELYHALRGPEARYRSFDYELGGDTAVTAKPINGRYSVVNAHDSYEIKPTRSLEAQNARVGRFEAREKAADERWRQKVPGVRARIPPGWAEAAGAALGPGGKAADGEVREALSRAGVPPRDHDRLLSRLVYIGDLVRWDSGGRTWYERPRDVAGHAP